ncbi:MAG TPA: glycosyltransferase [Thermoanaerobaculia bacterium]|nr:glycosyltransferase [Thermoanaerobaculia bacterium]
MVRISVVVPTYNLAGVIGRTLESVQRQTSLPDEIIVLDDGSGDATRSEAAEAAARFPSGIVRVIAAPHGGPGAARNRAIDQATGDWVAFLDGDDLWAPEKIEKLRAVIASNVAATMIAHDEYESDLNGGTIYKRLHERFNPSKPLLTQLYRGNFLSTSCIAVKRELLSAVGGLDETLPAAQDYDLWLKLARAARLVFIPEPLETYVLRENSITSRVLMRAECMTRIAFRHAPWVAAETGPARAWVLRLRALAIAYISLIRQSFSHSPAEAVRLLLRALGGLLRAVISPLAVSEN